MIWEDIFKILEDRQRYMTSNRYEFPQDEITLNGCCLVAVELQCNKTPRINYARTEYVCPNTQCQKLLGKIEVINKFTGAAPKHCDHCGQALDWRLITQK